MLSIQEKFIKATDIDYQINRLVSKDKDVVNENANKDSNTYSTKRDLIAGQVSRAKGISMLPEKVRNAHLSGDIYFHDLDYSPFTTYHNCMLIDVENMQKNGYKLGNVEVGSPKSIGTAVIQITQIVAGIASSIFGGITVDKIDIVLGKYAEMNYQKHKQDAVEYGIKDIETYAVEKTKKDIYDACQSLEYQINSLYTSNGQTPFFTVGFGLGTSRWERYIQQCILNIRIEGLGVNKETAIFPKLIYVLKKGINVNKDDINYDIKQLAIKCTSERIYPDYLSAEVMESQGLTDSVPMGCRSHLHKWMDENGEYTTSGRANMGVVTLNLPRIAMESDGDFDKFWGLLEERADIIHEALLFRINSVLQAKPKNAPILYKEGAMSKKLQENESIASRYLNKRATVSFGYIGMYETVSVFFGPEWENNSQAKDFSVKILSVLKDKCDEWTEEHDVKFSLYGTPSESLTDKFCKMDYNKFGSIENITDKGYYTNSFHYDTRKHPTPFEKIKFESPYSKIASGGFIHYVECPNMKQNLMALESIINYAYSHVGYFGVNSPIDRCYECDFSGEFNSTEHGYECPKCHNDDPEKSNVVRRLCGYLGQPLLRPEIEGRHKEIASRQKHM